MHWTEEFFDEYYLKSTAACTGEEQTREEVDFILQQIPIEKDKPILDLACGYGRHALELAQRGYHNVKGIDLTARYVEMARENAKSLPNPPEFSQMDMQEISEQDSYDLIYNLFSSLFYFHDEKNLDILQRIFTALKPEGYFLIDHFNPNTYLNPAKSKEWYFTKDNTLFLEKISHNPVSGMITNERIIITPDGNRINRVFNIRDYSAAELRYHFENIGFEIINVFGDFQGRHYQLNSPRQIFIMRKPG